LIFLYINTKLLSIYSYRDAYDCVYIILDERIYRVKLTWVKYWSKSVSWDLYFDTSVYVFVDIDTCFVSYLYRCQGDNNLLIHKTEMIKEGKTKR